MLEEQVFRDQPGGYDTDQARVQGEASAYLWWQRWQEQVRAHLVQIDAEHFNRNYLDWLDRYDEAELPSQIRSLLVWRRDYFEAALDRNPES